MHKNTWPVFFFPIQYFEYVLLQEEEEDKKKKLHYELQICLSCNCRIIRIIGP